MLRAWPARYRAGSCPGCGCCASARRQVYAVCASSTAARVMHRWSETVASSECTKIPGQQRITRSRVLRCARETLLTRFGPNKAKRIGGKCRRVSSWRIASRNWQNEPSAGRSDFALLRAWPTRYRAGSCPRCGAVGGGHPAFWRNEANEGKLRHFNVQLKILQATPQEKVPISSKVCRFVLRMRCSASARRQVYTVCASSTAARVVQRWSGQLQARNAQRSRVSSASREAACCAAPGKRCRRVLARTSQTHRWQVPETVVNGGPLREIGETNPTQYRSTKEAVYGASA